MAGKRNFDNFVDAFMEYVSYADAPEKFFRWSALSVVAGALERKVWVTNGAATWYPNLYVMLVGDAGSRKSTSSEMAIDLLRSVPGIEFLADRLNEASLLSKLKAVGGRKKFGLGVAEYKHSAAFLYASEAATSFSEMYTGGGIIVTLTDLFNCGPRGWHDVHAWTKHTLKDGELQIFNPCLNLLACSTPSWLTTKVMSRMDAEGGFGSRLLLVVHKGEYRKNFKWHQPETRQFNMRQRLLEDLTDIHQMSGSFQLDKTFEAAIEKYDSEHTRWLQERKANALVSGYQERKITHAIKLSQVISASEGSGMMLTAAHLDKAWELLSDLEHQMMEAFGSLNSTPEMRNYNLIWDYIVHHKLKKVVKSELMMVFQDRMSVKEIGQVLRDLLDSSRLTFLPRESSQGRLIYGVNDGSNVNVIPLIPQTVNVAEQSQKPSKPEF